MAASTFSFGKGDGDNRGSWRLRLTTAQLVVTLLISLGSVVGGAVTLARGFAEPMVKEVAAQVVEQSLVEKGLASDNALQMHLAVDKVEKQGMMELLQQIDARLARIERRLDARRLGADQ